MDYQFADIVKAYKQLGLKHGQIVHFKSNLASLGILGGPDGKPVLDREPILETHYRALRECIGSEGTIAVSVASPSLMGTKTPFDPESTPSEMGVFSESLRVRKDAIRSHHAFCSYAAEGPQAAAICSNTSRNDYGPFTPEQRMCELDAWDLTIGLEPNATCSVVHDAEFMMGVPYRYQKEFLHPVRQRTGKVQEEPFYCFVWYRGMHPDCDSIDRGGENRNRHFFKEFVRKGNPLKNAALGRAEAWYYPMAPFCQTCMEMMKENPYAFLARPPVHRPYQK